jgi:chromate transport protein ChrA
MLSCINYIYRGFLAGGFLFLLWWYSNRVSLSRQSAHVVQLTSYSLPGAIGMYGLSFRLSQIGKTLLGLVYALLLGLNAVTVGIITLAAVQLAEKAITNNITRAPVFLVGVTGILYTTLWYYAMLMLVTRTVTVVWDYR